MASTSSQNPLALTSNLPPITWDVFLSFHGDTRYKFTSHLQAALDRHGLRTFIDDPELRSGEVISDTVMQAIQESKTFVVVFSKNYTSSSWCLDELVGIHHFYETMQRLVIPVFYNIDPSVVQKHETRGKIKEYFLKKALRKILFRSAVKIERVAKWRLALTRVAGFSGETVSAERSESDVINQVVERVLLEIKTMMLDVAKYPVGLESRVKDITALLSSDTEGVIKIGIYGMGGVGKTTLAKAVYNHLYYSFQGSCFLENVREVSRTAKGLVCLQQQLINDVLKSKNIYIDNVDQGIELIRARICSRMVLIVIDDLEDSRPLDFLGPFALGSMIIITTRNEDLLDSIKVKTRYKVNELGDGESRQLLSQHAFGDNKISDTYMELSMDILKLAGGLPLALKVFGLKLIDQSEEELICIDKLKKDSIDDVEKKLVISFDALKLIDPMLQDIFLDITCFFIGQKKEEVAKILETCYTFVNHNINILKKRCLLTINIEDELVMHDLFLSMGRKIVCNNSPCDHGKHSRLWASKDISDVLKNDKGTETIEGIKYQNAVERVSFETKAFKRMSKLRFLYLENVDLTGSFEHSFENLRFLFWECCPLESLPSEFYPLKLVTLSLPRSKMRTMWPLNMVSKVFEKLKTLNMSDSQDLTTTPDFTTLPFLETLNLEHCERLEEVHISIGSLVGLVSINLCGCVNLRSLPESICNLRTLKSLNINCCSMLKELPVEFGNIESLEELNAENLSVWKLPDTIGHLSNLVELTLSHSYRLQTLPDNICNLKALKVLNIGDCSSLEALPTEFGNIESLEELNAEGLSVSKLPESIGRLGKLVELKINDNHNLQTLPDTICNFRELKVLNIGNCTSLEALPREFGNIESLEELNAEGLSVSKLPDSIGRLSKLVKLKLNFNYKLQILPDTLCNLRALEVLHIRYCSSLEALPTEFGNIESLEELNAEGLSVLRLPDSIGRLGKLVELKINDNHNLQTLPDTICNLRELKVLNIGNCTSLEALPREFGNIESLEELNAEGLSVSKLPDSIGRLSKLVKLKLNFNYKLQILPDTLCNLRALEVLHIRYCSSLEALPTEFGNIESLEELNAEGLSVLKLPDSIGRLGKLVELKLNDNHNLQTLPDTICNLRALEVLHIRYCSSLEALPTEFGNIESLEELNAEGLSVSKLPDSIGRLSKLVELRLSHNSKLITLPDTLCNLRALEVLHIKNCSSLEALPIELGGIESLKELNLEELTVSKLPDSIGCLCKLVELRLSHNSKLITLPDTLCNLRALEVLHIKNCSSLEALPIELGDIESLKELNLEELTVSKLPDSIGCLCNLVELKLNYNQKLQTLPDTICNLRALKVLNVEWLTISKLPDSIGRLSNLVELRLSYNNKLITLPDTLCNLRALEVLHIAYCSSLEALPIELGAMESLKELSAEGLAVSILPDSIGHLSKLVKLRIGNNKKLENLPDTIFNMRALEILDISGCKKLETLPNQLWELTRLTELKAGGAIRLKKLPDIKTSQIALSLRTLDISGSILTALPSGFSQLSNLEEFHLRYCRHLLFIAELPLNLKQITADGCRSLKGMLDLSNCKQLEILGLSNCRGLKEIQGLEELTSIRELSLGGCNSSLLAYNFKKLFFQIYSQFGHRITISTTEAELNRIIREPGKLAVTIQFVPDKTKTKYKSTQFYNRYLGELQPKASHNFLAMILCFTSKDNEDFRKISYSVKTTTSYFHGSERPLDRHRWFGKPESLMVIIPRSIFLIRDDDREIEVKVWDADAYILGIHLVYKTE